MSGSLQATFMNQRSFGTPFFFGRYGTTSANQANQSEVVCFTSSNGTLFAGSEAVYPSGGGNPTTSSATVVNINADKTTQFRKNFTQTGVELNFLGCASDSSGNVYATGTHLQSSVYRIILSKFNNAGVFQWARTLGSGTGIAFASNVGTDSAGNVYVGGYAKTDASSGVYYFYIAKYDNSGTLQWQRQLTQTTGNNISADFVVDATGNCYLTGYSVQSGTGFGMFIKYNSSGTLQFQKRFFGSSFSNGSAIAVDTSSNIYIGGYTGQSILAKFDSTGAQQWVRSLTSVSYSGIAVDTSGNVYGCGEGVDYRGQIVKYNSSGSIQWQRDLNATGLSGQNFKYWFSVAVDQNGDLGLVGITGQGGGGINNNLTLVSRFPTSGVFTGSYTFGSTVYTISNGTGTNSTGSLTVSDGSLTDSAGVFTSSSVTLTESNNTTAVTLVNV